MATSLEEFDDAILDFGPQALRSLGSLIKADDKVNKQLGTVPGGSFRSHDVDLIAEYPS